MCSCRSCPCRAFAKAALSGLTKKRPAAAAVLAIDRIVCFARVSLKGDNKVQIASEVGLICHNLDVGRNDTFTHLAWPHATNVLHATVNPTFVLVRKPATHGSILAGMFLLVFVPPPLFLCSPLPASAGEVSKQGPFGDASDLCYHLLHQGSRVCFRPQTSNSRVCFRPKMGVGPKGYPKWNPGRMKRRLNLAVFWWFHFDPYPNGQRSSFWCPFDANPRATKTT